MPNIGNFKEIKRHFHAYVTYPIHVKWALYCHRKVYSQVVAKGASFQTWRVTVNILNPRQLTMGGSPAGRLSGDLTTTCIKH